MERLPAAAAVPAVERNREADMVPERSREADCAGCRGLERYYLGTIRALAAERERLRDEGGALAAELCAVERHWGARLQAREQQVCASHDAY